MLHKIFVRGLAVAGLVCLSGSAVLAQTPAEFFRGKTIDLYIAYSAGGAYDLYARMISRHIGKHIPGHPTIVPKNMEGAGGLRLANYLANAAPRDGTAIGRTNRHTNLQPMPGQKAGQDHGPTFPWLGSANDEVAVCVSWHASGIASFDELLTREMTVGSTG